MHPIFSITEVYLGMIMEKWWFMQIQDNFHWGMKMKYGLFWYHSATKLSGA